MAQYQLKSGNTVLVGVASSSDIDDGAFKSSLRGTTFRTLSSVVVQYMESAVVGERRVRWHIPRLDGSQRGILASASVGTWGYELTLNSPDYGDVSVAFEPGPDGYKERKLTPAFGYEADVTFVRLA